jgi:hypothetical protein
MDNALRRLRRLLREILPALWKRDGVLIRDPERPWLDLRR